MPEAAAVVPCLCRMSNIVQLLWVDYLYDADRLPVALAGPFFQGLWCPGGNMFHGGTRTLTRRPVPPRCSDKRLAGRRLSTGLIQVYRYIRECMKTSSGLGCMLAAYSWSC